MRSLALPTAAG